MNRGRVQAQGGGTEKSEAWALQTDHYKNMGISSVHQLQVKLTPSEIRLRRDSFQKCIIRISTTPSCGVSAPMKKSYYDDPRNRKIRVDIEVNEGVAFIDNPII